MRILALVAPALLLAPLALASTSCIAAVGVGAGAVVTHEFLSDTPHVAHVQQDVDEVWPTTVETLRELGATEVEVTDYPRLVEANVQGGRIYVTVEAYDLNHTVVRLQFRKHRMIDNRTAEQLLQKLIEHYQIGQAQA